MGKYIESAFIQLKLACIYIMPVVLFLLVAPFVGYAIKTDEEGFTAIPKQLKTADEKSTYLQHLLDSAFLNQNNTLAALTYAKMGAIKYQEAYYKISISYFSKSIYFARLTKNKELIANNYNRIGVSYRQIDDLKNAFIYHKKALDMALEIKNSKIQEYALNGIGNIHLVLNHPDKAIVYFRESLKLANSRGNLLGIAINTANIGGVYALKKSYSRAIGYYHKSLNANRQINNKRGMRICYSEIGSILLKTNQIEKAIAFAKLSLSESGAATPIDSAYFYLTISQIHLAQRKYSLSEGSAQKAVNIGLRIKSKSTIYDAYNLLSTIYKKTNRREAYLNTYELALEYRDSVNKEYAQREIADLQQTSEIERKDSRINQLTTENRIKELERSKSEHTLVIVVLCAMLALMVTLLFSKKIARKAIRSSNDFELKLLRSQMNPHFIYNSLNSIQKFIWSNSPEQASVYLSNFSMLMRKTLESMQLDHIPLSKEIEFLALYLELEKQRLSNGFKYSITLAEGINADDINIPPLIIQPFIENAIWHGIAPLLQSNNGAISISYSMNDQFLTAKIEDNGIGVSKSKILKSSRPKTHESAGMTITTERLQIIYKTNNIKHFNDIKITDASELDPNSHGTTVIVHIPYKEIY